MILLLIAILILLDGSLLPAFGQHVICCNQLVNVGGKWVGASRTCDLSGLPPDQRARSCQKLAGCADAAPYCGVERPCTETGSLIDIHNQALGDTIRLSGTPFSLRYRSDRIYGGRADSFPNSLAGWSPNVHFAYDTVKGILYTGDGRRRIVRVQAGSEIRIPSEDGTVLYVFDGKGRHLRTLDSFTGAVHYRFAYDNAGGLTRIEDGSGNSTRIERDAKGTPAAIVAQGGQRILLSATPDGYLAGVTNPAGETTRLNYSKDGLLTSLTDPKGQVHRFTYSSKGNLLKDENPGGGHWALERKKSGGSFNIALKSALGRTYTYGVEHLPAGGERRVNAGSGGAAIQVEKNKEGNDKVIYPDGAVSSSEFRPDPRWGTLVPLLKSFSLFTPSGLRLSISADRKVSLAQPGNPLSLRTLSDAVTINGRQYMSSFDVSKRELVKTTPAGRQIITTLDDYGRVRRREISGFLPVNFAYDDKGRLSSITQGAGDEQRVTAFSYDEEGRLTAAADRLKRVTRFEYDRAGRVSTQIFADGREVRFGYDANGNLTAVTPPGRPVHNFEYTPVDLRQSYLPPSVGAGGKDTRYTYDRDKRLTRVTWPDGKNVGIDYDKAGHVSLLTIPQGKIRYLFNSKTNQLQSVTAVDGGTLSFKYDGFLPTTTSWNGTIQGSVSRAYDNDFRLSSITINGKQSVGNRYDPDGLLVQAGALTLERHPKTRLVTGTKLGNVTTTQEYNGFGKIKRLTAAFKSREIFAVEYERDAAGRIVKKIETVEGQTRTFLYVYDLAGRLTEVVRVGASAARYEYDGNGNRLTYQGPLGDSKGSYDAQDRLVSYGGVTYRYTPSGELAGKSAGGKNTGFDYDALGNLRGANLPGEPKIDYVIDGVNRRIGKKLNGKLVQGFLYGDQLKPVAELDARSNVVSIFAYGTKVNVPEYVEKNDGIYRIVTDHLGSPRLVINIENGTIAQRMDFDEFGNALQDTTAGFQPFGFAGGLYDPHTKLTHFGARDYDASTGRWTAKDPAGFGGGLNLYEYVANNPVNRADPWGLQESDPFGVFSGPNWSDPEITTIVEIDSAGNVTRIDPGNPVDFPFTADPAPEPGIVEKLFPGVQDFADRLKDRHNKGWTIYNGGAFRFTFKGPGLDPDRYGQEDAPPGTCVNSTTGEQQSQNPYRVPPSPGAGGGAFRWHFF